MTTRDVRAIDITRHREHWNASGRPASRVERAAARGSFNNNHGIGQRGYHAVTLQKLRRKSVVVGRERREYRTIVREHALRKRAVAPREKFVVSAAEHANRRCAGVERAFMRGRIYA